MKILKPTFCDLLRPQSSLATIVVVSSPDVSTTLGFKFSLCYLLALSLSFLFYKMGMRNMSTWQGWENRVRVLPAKNSDQHLPLVNSPQ